MINVNSFGVFGGDKRQIEMAKSIVKDGYDVYVSGFEKFDFTDSISNIDVLDMISKCECIILPLPVTKDIMTLNAPFSDNKFILDKNLVEKLKSKKVFGGMTSNLYKISSEWKKIQLYDYYNREEYAIKNAVPTAEGAIEIAMREYLGTLNGAKCLITGFGRIGKVLSKRLKDLGAVVTVSARKQSDLAWIEVFGYNPIKTVDIFKTNGYDLIFNTIPYKVFDYNTLRASARSAIVIDLASLPGGVDFEAAKRLNIKTVHALALPGQIAPKTAGEITKQTIYNMLKEDGG